MEIANVAVLGGLSLERANLVMPTANDRAILANRALRSNTTASPAGFLRFLERDPVCITHSSPTLDSYCIDGALGETPRGSNQLLVEAWSTLPEILRDWCNTFEGARGLPLPVGEYTSWLGECFASDAVNLLKYLRVSSVSLEGSRD